VATTSYLEDVAGGPVSAAAFEDDDAVSAVTLLLDSGVREQDISVIAGDRRRAVNVAGDRAWLPGKGWNGLFDRLQRLLPGGALPKEIRRRYGEALRKGKIVVVAAAGGQPVDTLAALLRQANGDEINEWWQSPSQLFAPPELAGPF
jgi:hypothetical protein